MPEPDKLPEWASQDVTDPSSGQPNVSEPPDGRKDSGWNRREIPPRQWFNWIHRYNFLWTAWFKNITVPKTLDGSTTNTADDTGHTHNITKTTKAQAETGTNDVGMMTALKTKQAVDAYGFIAANNLQEIEDSGAAAQAAARENLGYSEVANIELGGDFDAGVQIDVARFGNVVTITSNGALTHASLSAVLGADGVIPAEYRPDVTSVRVLSDLDTTGIKELSVTNSGRVTGFYRQFDGTAYSTTDGGRLTVSFIKTGSV